MLDLFRGLVVGSVPTDSPNIGEGFDAPKNSIADTARFWQVGGPAAWKVQRYSRVAGTNDVLVMLIRADGAEEIGPFDLAYALALGVAVSQEAAPDPKAPAVLAQETAAIERTMAQADRADAAFEAGRPGLLDDLSESAGNVGTGIGGFFGKALGGVAKVAGSVFGEAIGAFIIAAWPILAIIAGVVVIGLLALWLL